MKKIRKIGIVAIVMTYMLGLGWFSLSPVVAYADAPQRGGEGQLGPDRGGGYMLGGTRKGGHRLGRTPSRGETGQREINIMEIMADLVQDVLVDADDYYEDVKEGVGDAWQATRNKAEDAWELSLIVIDKMQEFNQFSRDVFFGSFSDKMGIIQDLLSRPGVNIMDLNFPDSTEVDITMTPELKEVIVELIEELPDAYTYDRYEDWIYIGRYGNMPPNYTHDRTAGYDLEWHINFPQTLVVEYPQKLQMMNIGIHNDNYTEDESLGGNGWKMYRVNSGQGVWYIPDANETGGPESIRHWNSFEYDGFIGKGIMVHDLPLSKRPGDVKPINQLRYVMQRVDRKVGSSDLLFDMYYRVSEGEPITVITKDVVRPEYIGGTTQIRNVINEHYPDNTVIKKDLSEIGAPDKEKVDEIVHGPDHDDAPSWWDDFKDNFTGGGGSGGEGKSVWDWLKDIAGGILNIGGTILNVLKELVQWIVNLLIPTAEQMDRLGAAFGSIGDTISGKFEGIFAITGNISDMFSESNAKDLPDISIPYNGQDITILNAELMEMFKPLRAILTGGLVLSTAVEIYKRVVGSGDVIKE